MLYEDAYLIVVDKPPGMAVHPAPGSESGTLVNALLHHCGDSLSGIGGVARPGIVHRIDKNTSGIVVVAKTDAAHQGLSKLFAAHDIDRVYIALTRGAPRTLKGTIEGAIGRSSADRKKMALVRSGGRHAITHYAVERTVGPKEKPLAARIACTLETGRTHQIRVHLASVGAPCLGDPLYGSGPPANAVRAAIAEAGLTRQALHAAVLGFRHPITGETLRFERKPLAAGHGRPADPRSQTSDISPAHDRSGAGNRLATMAPSFGRAQRRRLFPGSKGDVGGPRGRPRDGRRVILTSNEPSRPVRRASLLCAGVSAAALACAAPSLAAPAPASGPAPKVSELVVQAAPKAEPGAVVGDIKPDLQLAPQDIQAYGVSTITELLDELAPEIGSNSGRGGEGPAILVNGRRISGINEIRNLPTEAILRVDILPEEAALKYGFSANQRVVNIVLKDHVDVELADLLGGASTEGGGAAGQAEAGVTRISGERRLNIDLKYNPQASLTEAQRNITPLVTGPTVDLAGNPVDQRPFRTLVAESQKVSLNAVLTQPIFAGISATVNGTFEDTTTDAQRGLPAFGFTDPSGNPVARLAPSFGPLNQTADTWTGHLGVSFKPRHLATATWR